jgi:carbonic anhydrase
LRPGYDRIKDMPAKDQHLTLLEREAVVVSIENLMSFPFVSAAVANETLSVHGLWTNISDGALLQYNAETNKFDPIES